MFPPVKTSIPYCAYFSTNSDAKKMLTGESNIILKHSICLLQKCFFSFHKMIIDGLESCELRVGYCDVLNSV